MVKAKAKAPADNPPTGTASTAKQDSAAQQDPSITPDSAMNYLTQASGNQSFADFQATQAAQTAPDAQAASDTRAAQDTQVAQDAQAASDTRAAQGTQIATDTSQSATQAQGAGALDWDDADDAAMQQALLQSRQQAQMQGSDPTASSSTRGQMSKAGPSMMKSNMSCRWAETSKGKLITWNKSCPPDVLLQMK